MKTKAVALMFLAKIARNVACLSAFFVLSASAAPVAKVGEAEYETLEAAIQAATPDANGVIEYQILGKAEVSASGWVQVVKAGLSSVSKVAFVGKTADAEICITKGVAILADQTYDLDISFENLKLSKLNPKWAKDYGHGTEYFTTWLRNTGAAENTVTYTNCKFPNGVCNNQYGKTIFEDCTFANATTGSYNMWVYGGAVEMSGCAFSGTRGVKVYTEGTPDTAPTVDVKATLFAGLTEKAAIVVSKAATVALKDVSVTDCARGTFQKAIEGASENVTLAANGTGLAGTFAITAEKDPASAKTEFNVSAGTFTAEVSADYCAEGFTVKATTDASGNTVYGVEAADPRTLGYATSGAAAALPAVPDMGGTVVNVTAAQAQYVLDGAYGSIDGKTINFTESVADTLVLGRASKYEGSGTLYRHGSHDGEAMSYSDFIAVKNQGCYYERTVENVTFTADEGVVVNFTAEGGAHVYGTESAPVYDYVRDTGTWIRDTNNSFYKRAILKNITFRSLTFTAKTDFNTSESLTVYDGFTFTNCTFEIGSTAAGNYALRYYNENNNGSVKNLVVENCAFRNCFQGIYTHHVKGITVKNCLFDTTGHNAIAIQSQGGKGACDHGAVVITGNTFKNIGDRIIRFNMVGAGTTITIADNTADGNSGKLLDSATGKREIVAASSLPENASEIITASNNDWGANAVVGNDEFADTRPVVAKIGETGYASLADALAAAQDGETVTLLADAAEDAVVATSVTLDLGGKTLTNAGAGKVTLTIAEGATVTVKNGSIVGGASNYAIQNNGTATFEDVTATAGNVGSSMLDNFGTLTINSGTYVGGMNTVKNEPKATLTVNGGTFENSYGENNAHTGVIYNLGHVAITGGELTQKATGPLWAGPHVVMTNWDGSNKPSVTITGGTFTSVWSSWRASILNHAGGGTAGCTTVSGGTFNKKVPEDYCAEGFIPTANDDGTFGVKEGAYVAAIGEAKYETVDAAIAAAQDGDTVKMLADVNNADYTVANVIDVSLASGVTLDGNGKTLSGNVKVTVASAGGVTIKNVLFKDIHNAAVVSADAKKKYGFGDAKVGTLSAVYAPKLAGSLTVTGCTFENCDWEALQITPVEGAKIDIRGNVFKTSASDLVMDQLRHLHIEMAYGEGIDGVKFDYEGTDIEIAVTDNQFLGGAKDAAAGIWWVGEASVLALSGNYYAEPDTVSITLSDGKNRTNRCDLIYPARSQADVDVDDLMASALVVHDDFNASAYSTLAEAIAAAKDGETVKLLADANGDGIRVPENAFPTGLVVDFAGHTYTVGGLLVGSSATKSNGFQLLKGNKITFKNGTLVGATATAGEGTGWTGAPAILIQNYCDLTLEKMTVKGGDETCYTLSNNNGDIVIADSTIVAGKGTKGPFAFDVCRFSTYPKVHVTVTGDSVIAGDVEVSGTVGDGQSRQLDIAGGTFKGTFSVVDKPANIAISGGTFSTAVLPDYCAAGFIPTANGNGTFGVKEGAYVAAIGDVKYETLAEAFDAAKKGDTVTLLADITLTEQVNITKALDGLTLDGNNKTITCATTTDPFQRGGSALYFGNADSKLYCTGIAIKDLTMTGTARFAIFLCGGTSTTFTNVKISGNYYIAVNLYGTHGATMTDCEISNSTTGTDKYISAIWSNVASGNPLTLNNTKVNVIAINEYTKDNELKPKICVNEGSTVGEIHTFDYGKISGDTRLCVGASPVMPSVKTWDTNTVTWIVAPDEVVVNALIGGGRVTLPASLLAQVLGTTRFDRFSKLKEPDANGNLAWVNLVAGIDPAKKVTMTAPQNGKPGVIDVKLSAVSEPPSGTDVTVAYEIVKDGSETVAASATAADSLALTLDGTAGIGVYRAVLSLRQNGSEVARVGSANALGVLQTVRAANKTIIAVPWLSLTDGNAIAVADLVKTAGLTAGDKLHVYNKAESRYDVYGLTKGKAWEPKAIYKVGADGTGATALSGAPETTTVARGSGVWLERKDTTQPIVSYGAVASATVATTLDAGTKEKPAWHLLAVPTTTAIDIATTFGTSETDEIIVPTDGSPKIFRVKGDEWWYEQTVSVVDKFGKPGVRVVQEAEAELPAGTGFWYLNGGEAKTVNW